MVLILLFGWYLLLVPSLVWWTKIGRCRVCLVPSLLDQNRPVPSLFGADILGAEWVPSLRGDEFAGAEFARCRSVRYPVKWGRPFNTRSLL